MGDGLCNFVFCLVVWFILGGFVVIVVFCWVSPRVCDFMLVYVMVGGCCRFGGLVCELCLGG